LVSLALIRLAYIDPDSAAVEIDKLRWKAQLNQEERSWVWGVIGKRSAQKLSDEAPATFAKGQLAQMHEDHLVWAARAALRAGRWSQVADAIAAMPGFLAQRLDLGLLARPRAGSTQQRRNRQDGEPDAARIHRRHQGLL